jgi:hypothetical protein
MSSRAEPNEDRQNILASLGQITAAGPVDSISIHDEILSETIASVSLPDGESIFITQLKLTGMNHLDRIRQTLIGFERANPELVQLVEPRSGILGDGRCCRR